MGIDLHWGTRRRRERMRRKDEQDSNDEDGDDVMMVKISVGVPVNEWKKET